MTKHGLQWLTFFLLAVHVGAWLPSKVHRKHDSPFRSPQQSLELSRQKLVRLINDENHASLEESDGFRDLSIVLPSRRGIFRYVAASAVGFISSDATMLSLPQSNLAHAYTIDKVDPDENDIYAEAQNMPGHLKVLWVGSGSLKSKSGGTQTGEALSGVYKNLFKPGNEVTALDLLEAKSSDYKAAKKYAKDQGYVLRYQQGDATKLDFADETFDVVVCSCFLSQPFDPVVVVNEINRVLKPGGRFGFYEHKTDIDTVVVGKVFGEASIVKLVAYPELQNILAGVVKKV